MYDAFLFESWTYAQASLLASLGWQGKEQIIVLEDDGWLDAGIHSPWLYIRGEIPSTKRQPLPYYQLQVPDFWEVRPGGQRGQILNGERVMAYVYYGQPRQWRWVKRIDWLKSDGQVSHTDCYDANGQLYAKVFFQDGVKIASHHYKGQELVLVEDHTSGKIALDFEGQRFFFQDRMGFYTWYLRRVLGPKDRLCLDRLGVTLQLTLDLGGIPRHSLVFHESIGVSQIPGNLVYLLNQPTNMEQILLDSEEKLRLLQASPWPHLDKLGLFQWHLPIQEKRFRGKEALIVTYSDQLPWLNDILSLCPDWTIHIAAPSEMSPKLLALGHHRQVRLYPAASWSKIQDLIQGGSVLLDLQEGGEVESTNQEAFLASKVLLARAKGDSPSMWVSASHVFASSEELTSYLASLSEEASWERALEKQLRSFEQYLGM